MNDVSAVAQTVTGAIVSLVNIVYSAAVLAYTYIDHLAREAAALGGALVQRLAASYLLVGDILLLAIELLLEAAERTAEAVLAPLTSEVAGSIASYGSEVQSSFAKCVQDYAANGSVTIADAAAFFSALGGGLFLLIFGLGTLAAIALLILSAFAVGPSFVASTIFSQISGSGYKGAGSVLEGTIGSPTGLGTALISATETFANSVGESDGLSTHQTQTIEYILGAEIGLAGFVGGVVDVACVNQAFANIAIVSIGGLSVAFSILFHNNPSYYIADFLAWVTMFLTFGLFPFVKTDAAWAGLLMGIGSFVLLNT